MLTPRTDALARLLLLCARSRINESQRSAVRALAAEINDWSEAAPIAEAKFASTYLFKHLAGCASDLVPQQVMDALRSDARRTGMSVLRTAASLVRFHTRCIEPSGAPHAYVKGLALSSQFSLPLHERFCRDIDVLIDGRYFHGVLAAAVASNYHVLLDTDPLQVAKGPADLNFLARYADVVTLLDDEGVVIEVHRKLDKLSVNFDIAAALRDPAKVTIAGVTVSTLGRPLHFVYAAYHHARHFWSRLHWLADLDGMIDSIDRPEALSVAAQLGIQPAIQAAFELRDLTASPVAWDQELLENTHAGEYLRACLTNLRGGLEVEESLRANLTLNDFMAAWQISPDHHEKFRLRSWLHRVRPTVTQYRDRRYPNFLHWLYSAQNALSLCKNAFLLVVGRGPTAPRPDK